MAKKSSRMRRLLSGVLSAVMLATLVPSTAFAIGRTDTGSFLTGPYLMTPKTNGMVVVWELDKPMKSTITYGTSDADKKTLEVPVEEGEKFKGENMHMYRARLTDLTPGTTYTYKVETEDGQTMDGHFRTLPENSNEIRFVVVSDSHRFETATKVSDVIAVRSGLYPAYRRYGRGHRLSEGSVPVLVPECRLVPAQCAGYLQQRQPRLRCLL